MKWLIATLLILTMGQVQAQHVKIEYNAFKPGYGSGFVAMKTGNKAIVLTNRHVVPDHGYSIVVNWPNGYKSFARHLGFDYRADIAALVVTVPDNVKVATLADTDPEAFEEVFKIGYPAGVGPDRREGFVCEGWGWRINPWDDNELMKCLVSTTLTRPGDSGSPVFNKDWQVVGMIWGGMWIDEFEFYSSSICLDDLRRFLTWKVIVEEMR